MSVARDVMDPAHPKRVLLVAANAAVSPVTGWPVGFWWAELTHPYLAFVESGYEVDIGSPDGGDLEGDAWSDPRHESGYSADDLISLGFLSSPRHASLVKGTRPLGEIDVADYDAVFVAGGQSPMVTMLDDERLHASLAAFYERGKVVAVVCHATCALLRTRLSSGALLVEGKTWTGFANAEEAFADDYVGRRIQPFWIEDEAKQLPNTNFIVAGRFKPHAVRDGRLITGQQQYSGAAAARRVIEALGI